MSTTHSAMESAAGDAARIAPPEKVAGRRGLILIQIDGLSRTQLERALGRGKAPFLRHLLERQHYRLRTMYSGLPSTTPAVQGELFYGVPRAVPAFGYIPRGEAETVFMNDGARAAAVEEWLRSQGTGLLRGGSAQSDIYTGGAAEPRFCAAAMGWGGLLNTALPGAKLLFALAYMGTLLRAFGQALLEILVALVDFATALARGRWLRPELRIIPSRVVVDVLLRDAMTSAACRDAARGLPVIHLNYLGYDEKAHCRGPASRFAEHSLAGIDRSIRRLWKAAQRSAEREYELWIYSDHGQSPAEPYVKHQGRTLQAAVDAIWENASPQARVFEGSSTAARARWFFGRSEDRAGAAAASDDRPPATAVAIGPLGYIYLRDALTHDETIAMARRVVKEAHVPLVAVPQGQGGALAITSAGEFTLPEEARRVFGAGHPFAEEAARDLAALAHHPDAGEMLISGFRTDGETFTFVEEFGSHGGPGGLECEAFVLAPADAPIDWNDARLMRPADLREAALAQLRGSSPRGAKRRRAGAKTLRVMTYNVHSCIGLDGRLAPERIARVIELCNVDVVALQELDVRRKRSGGIDQAEVIAACLGWRAHFHPAMRFADEQYGDAILSRLPMTLIRAGTLPGPTRGVAGEPRGALWVELEIGASRLQLLNTHLGLTRRERLAQIDALLGPGWLGNPKCRSPVVLCGDFNALPGSAEYRKLAARLGDVRRQGRWRRGGTFPSRFPLLAIDHVFAAGVNVTSLEAPASELARRASDHLPVVVELSLEEPASR